MKRTFHHSLTLQVMQLMQTLQFLPEKTIFPLHSNQTCAKCKACMVTDQRFAILPVTSDATDANVTHTCSVSLLYRFLRLHYIVNEHKQSHSVMLSRSEGLLRCAWRCFAAAQHDTATTPAASPGIILLPHLSS